MAVVDVKPIVIPDMPTRQEIVEALNQVPRSKPFTVENVRRWEAEGWIDRHAAYQCPARYVTASVRKFIEASF